MNRVRADMAKNAGVLLGIEDAFMCVMKCSTIVIVGLICAGFGQSHGAEASEKPYPQMELTIFCTKYTANVVKTNPQKGQNPIIWTNEIITDDPVIFHCHTSGMYWETLSCSKESPWGSSSSTYGIDIGEGEGKEGKLEYINVDGAEDLLLDLKHQTAAWGIIADARKNGHGKIEGIVEKAYSCVIKKPAASH